MAGIKPLVWTWYEDDGDGNEVWDARTPFGWITVHTAAAPASPTWCWSSIMDTVGGYLTAEAAKDAAQRSWEEAVLECHTHHFGNVK